MKTLKNLRPRIFVLPFFLLAAGSLAHATTYTFTGNTAGTTTWSSGTGWNAVPVSASTTELVFGTGQALPSSAVITNQDIATPFLLNKLTTGYFGTHNFEITGGALNFVSNGATTPTIVLDSAAFSQVKIVSSVNFGNDIAIGGASDMLIAGAMTNTAGAVITKSGTGTLRTEFSNPNYTGNFNVTGGTLQVGNNSSVGDFGSGTVTLSNNANFVVRRNGGTLALNNTITGTGNVRFQLRNNFVATINKANDYDGPTSLEASASGAIGGIKLGIDNGLSTSTAFTITNNGSSVETFDLNGYNQTLGSLATASGGSITNSIITNTGAAKTLTISNTSGTTTYAGLISGAIALTKSGDSTQILSGANTYSGKTIVSGGKLTIDSTGTINGTSDVSIEGGEFNYNSSTALTKTVAFSGTGGTLSGRGTINLAVLVTAGNTLSIGNGPGTMNFGQTLGLAGTTLMEIDGTAGAGATGGHDFANVTGALTYGGALILDIGAIFNEGSYSWNLFDFAGSDLGAFSTITLADQYSGSLLDDDLDGVWNLTSGDNTWQFTESTGVLGLTVIPEPNSAALLGSLGLLALLRRRRA
jgi:autotransporter-associated beta strand protein